MLPFTINLSNTINIAGKMQITHNILTTAPRAIRRHKELIMSILEYTPTPKVAPKKVHALTITDFIVAVSVSFAASLLSFPSLRSVLYRLVINIA